MSAIESQTPSPSKMEVPEFVVSLRGYDRQQVDDWAKEMVTLLLRERQRATEAERSLRLANEEQPPPSFSHLGAHVAKILEDAGASAENMLADAAERAEEAIQAGEDEAGDIIKEAQQRAGRLEEAAQKVLETARAEGERVKAEATEDAEETRADADEAANAMLEEARESSEQLRNDAEQDRQAIEAEANRLETLRDRSLQQLGRLYGHLQSVVDEVRVGLTPYEGSGEPEEEAPADRGRVAVLRRRRAPRPRPSSRRDPGSSAAGCRTLCPDRTA